MKKIKYIFKKLLIIFFVAFISVFIYQIFMELKDSSNKSETYGTRISAEEETQSNSEDISSVIKKVSKAVVGISKIKNIGSSAFLSDSTENLGLGTGIIVSRKGYILTNQHVIGENASSCYVTVEDGNRYTGKIIWSNIDIDLAIIKVETEFNNVANLGDSNIINVGHEVFAIGNPIGYEFQRTVTCGIISAVDRTVKIKNEDETYSFMSNLIQTDATINPGNSGGPLINEEGSVIGINTIKITTAEGIGFAIPINIIKPIVEKFEEEGKFEEAYLGLFAYDGSVMSYINKDINIENGIYIEKIAEDGPANGIGLKKGDIIVKIDNTSVNKMCELQEYIFSKRPGDEILITIIRNNKEKQFKIMLWEK